jgi:hypothetical protein
VIFAEASRDGPAALDFGHGKHGCAESVSTTVIAMMVRPSLEDWFTFQTSCHTPHDIGALWRRRQEL